MAAPLQFVLDFFAIGQEPAPPHAQPAQPSPPAPPASDLLQPEPQAAQPGDFAHPGANRHALLHGMRVAYVLERSRRQSIGFMVRPEGLVVRAPAWVRLRDVDAAVQDKAHWIVSKLQQMQQRQSQNLPEPVVWADGQSLPYLGRTLRLAVHTAGDAQPNPDAATQGEPPTQLPLYLPPGAGSAQVREAAQAWLQKQALALFEQRLQHFAPLLGVRWTKLSLSAATTRWGSAKSNGHIRLNWRLIHLPISQIDYVVVHELAHLREMSHSPRFWHTVGTVMPDYAERRKQLRAHDLAQGLVGEANEEGEASEASEAG